MRAFAWRSRGEPAKEPGSAKRPRPVAITTLSRKKPPMKKLVLAAIATVALGTVACKKHEAQKPAPKAEAPKAEAPKAEAPKAAPATPPTAAAAPAPGAATGDIAPGKYTVDNVHSAVLFKARHFGAGFTYAWFKEFDGSFTVDADPAKSSIDFTVKTASVDSRNEKRDGHLKSPDFLNAMQFPTATFKSTKIDKAGDGSWNVTGDFTLRGKTKAVTARVQPLGTGKTPPPAGKTIAGFEGKFTVNRHDFDVSFGKGGLGDDVEITVALEGAQ